MDGEDTTAPVVPADDTSTDEGTADMGADTAAPAHTDEAV